MERLEKLINILKLTPHRQPELVKEASQRILSRSIRSEPQVSLQIKPLIEILIQYCDNDDSAHRSLFNDYLNSIVSTYQHQHYKLILRIFLNEVINNGSARAVTAALQRIPHLINNVKPVELGCEPQKLLKALIEVSRRSDDESVLKALDHALKYIMPYIDYLMRKNKEIQLHLSLLIETLLRNLHNESSQTRRVAASSIATICANSELKLQITLIKLKSLLEHLSQPSEISMTNKFVGFCLCVKLIPELGKQEYVAITDMILSQIESNSQDVTLVTAALETLRELFKYHTDVQVLDQSAKLIARLFLITEVDGELVVKRDTKVILQANALACISVIIKQRPTVFVQLESILLFKNHADIAVQSQLIQVIGNYLDASWSFSSCIEQSIDCERVRKLWVELRFILQDDNAHPDTLKSCIVAIKTCLNTLLESDHCLHIVEYNDFDHLIQLYLKSNYKPLKVELISLFATLNYRTLSYLEKNHWLRMRKQTAGSFVNSLQDLILNNIIIASIIDEHQKIRLAATSALVTLIPKLYITSFKDGKEDIFHKSCDPIVSLAQDLTNKNLSVLNQVPNPINDNNQDLTDKFCIRDDRKFLSSSILTVSDTLFNRQDLSSADSKSSQDLLNISINLKYVVGLIIILSEDSLEKGKIAISSIVRTLHEISNAYPIHKYPASWDCRPSESCRCFTLLNFLLRYLGNLTEPDVVVEDLEAYKNFLSLSQQLLYALCHESVLTDYENQRMKPFHQRQVNCRDGCWSELTLKHPAIADILDIYFTHLTKLLWLISYVKEERSNPFIMSKQTSNQLPVSSVNQDMLVSNRYLFGRIHKKLESSYRSSKKNLNQNDEKFYQILDTCLTGMSLLLEFICMDKSMDNVRDILGYIKIISPICSVSSLTCVRQLLKSLFGINILALYQVDPYDWFENESRISSTDTKSPSKHCPAVLQSVYHHLVTSPYKIFSSYCSSFDSPEARLRFDKALETMNFESYRALKVRRRIEDRVKSLFEYNPNQLLSSKVRQTSELLKNIITEFTPIVTDCMQQFSFGGFIQYQCETLHFMSYLILLRVNYSKLAQAADFTKSINNLLDLCGQKMFSHREMGMERFLGISFTFLTLLSYERGPSKAMFQVASVIQKLDDLRAKLSISSTSKRDLFTYVFPLMRCLVEDLFIYRTKSFQNFPKRSESSSNDPIASRDPFESLEAERETIAQKLLDVIENPKIFDLLSILILESRQNSNETKYEKLSKHLLSMIPNMLTKKSIDLTNYRDIESIIKIIESISPEVFQPVDLIVENLLNVPKPSFDGSLKSRLDFQRWMSLVIIFMHILMTQVKEEEVLAQLRNSMSNESFVEYLLHVAQLCIAEILVQLNSPKSEVEDSNTVFLNQLLSSYILYLTYMFQSGLFFQLSRSAADLIRREISDSREISASFQELCDWARDPANGFSLTACETMFLRVKALYPNLTIFWCNVMMLLNNVDCNRDFWWRLLVYECQHCKTARIDSLEQSVRVLGLDEKIATTEYTNGDESASACKTPFRINRPASLNLSDIKFNNPLRRSFIKRIAAVESRDKLLNRNIVGPDEEDGQFLEPSSANTEQCLSPNMELARRGALCLVLDFVTISMNDVEHITWLIIHHINDIIRWSHEMPITEFINAVHGNSASSGIFIQAINSGFHNLTSISIVTRLLWTLEQVHYTQYGSLVVLLVEKLLLSKELLAYRSLTKSIEKFACTTVQKLLNETNKSLVTTNDEVVNQLTAEDLDRIHTKLDAELYPNLSKLLIELHKTTRDDETETPTRELHPATYDSDDDSDGDDIEILFSKANLLHWAAEQNHTAHVSSLIPALNAIKVHLANPEIVKRVNKSPTLVCSLISSVSSLALTVLPPPKRQLKPKFWNNLSNSALTNQTNRPSVALGRPTLHAETRKEIKSDWNQAVLFSKNEADMSENELVEAVRTACIKGLFLLENINYFDVSQFECFPEVIIRLARLPLVNSFILTPPSLWRQNIWPSKFDSNDLYKTDFPMVTFDILLKDCDLFEEFCDRLLKLGWISRRQFEEAWMTLLGVLSTSISQLNGSKEGSHGSQEAERRANLLVSCKAVSTITKLILLTRRRVSGDPLSPEAYPAQNFDQRVIELTKDIGNNLNSLRKRTKGIFEMIEIENRSSFRKFDALMPIVSPAANDNQNTGFSHYLRISAQNLRMNAILEVNMQDTVVIDSEHDASKSDEVDVESCVRLLLSIYKQKFKDPNENLCSPTRQPSSSAKEESSTKPSSQQKNRPPNQLPPALTTAICQSILALSDIFTDYEQFDWLFDTFVQMFSLAERNEDEIQMQYLIVGLCKSVAVCCYDNPNESSSTAAHNHREAMFEKCRTSLEKCLKSSFGPLKINALFGVFYMLEDSIKIVASGAWELDHFKYLRQSRLVWISNLMPLLLKRENCRLLTKKDQVIKLLESLLEVMPESELKSMKSS